MAQKTVKKAPAKRPAAKKATVKKTTRTAPVVEEMVIDDAPHMHQDPEHHCHHDGGKCTCGHGGVDCGCHGNCGCHSGGCWGFIKKLFWFLVIFALGFAACLCVCSYGHRGHRGPKMPVEFVNGCLDTSKIKSAEFAEKVMTADVNNDNCISREEYRAVKKQMRKMRK